MPVEAPSWLASGDNAWQMTAATLVGLMRVPGLVVLYGGVMQKRWSINSMMLTFAAFAVVLVVWVLWAFKMGFGSPIHLFGSSSTSSFFDTMVGNPSSILGHAGLQHQRHRLWAHRKSLRADRCTQRQCAAAAVQCAHPLRLEPERRLCALCPGRRHS